MAIPEAQLNTWSKQGSIDMSSNTYQSIRAALEHKTSPLASNISSGNIKVYLQGSYANDTNVRGDSDVDVVVELTSTFHSNKHELPLADFQLHEATYAIASYDCAHLREDVITALSKYYGSNFIDTTGNKSVKVLPNNGRLRADIVPALEYRKYQYFHGSQNHAEIKGIAFYHRITHQPIINYPQLHYQNGVTKHADTSQRFKPIVRMIKNMVSCAVDKGFLAKDIAPSYFIQCMIYNVPNNLFAEYYSESFLNIIAFLSSANLSSFVCQHRMHYMFGNTDTTWHVENANETIKALIRLWQD